MYNSSYIVGTKDVVIVTANYRLGACLMCMWYPTLLSSCGVVCVRVCWHAWFERQARLVGS